MNYAAHFVSWKFQIVVFFLVHRGAFENVLLAALKLMCSFHCHPLLCLAITIFYMNYHVCGSYKGAGEFTIHFSPRGRGLHLLSLAKKVNAPLMPEEGGGGRGFQMTGA